MFQATSCPATLKIHSWRSVSYLHRPDGPCAGPAVSAESASAQATPGPTPHLPGHPELLIIAMSMRPLTPLEEHRMSEKELTLVERCVLINLMVKAAPLQQSYLINVAGVTGLKATHRRALEALGLIEVTEKPITLHLTDSGWEAAKAELSKDEPPKGAGTAGATLYTVLDFVRRLIDHSGVRADDLFRMQFKPNEIASTIDPAEPVASPASGSEASQVDVATRIRRAYHELVDQPGDYVMLAALRAALADLPGDDLDAALIKLNQDPDVDLIPESNQKSLTPQNRAAAVSIGNQDKHLIAISS
ncbi:MULTISPECIES: hypothetical protein [unclassified Solwaraspora]|uniref:hypothetical protein n=1 Tax=unclassified Solwaraspora TaxID=2627926 RepID=UPI00259B7BA0|nr:hypothetical protein [Solwaraspora sp. WMMA2056]WJK41718.1 hypothetical protein O7608_04655 [Solwaraspora sp. WMMA2056]